MSEKNRLSEYFGELEDMVQDMKEELLDAVNDCDINRRELGDLQEQLERVETRMDEMRQLMDDGK